MKFKVVENMNKYNVLVVDDEKEIIDESSLEFNFNIEKIKSERSILIIRR